MAPGEVGLTEVMYLSTVGMGVGVGYPKKGV